MQIITKKEEKWKRTHKDKAEHWHYLYRNIWVLKIFWEFNFRINNNTHQFGRKLKRRSSHHCMQLKSFPRSPVHEGQSLFLGISSKPTGYQPGLAVILYLGPLLFTNGDLPPTLLYDSPLSRIVLVRPEGRSFCIAGTGYNLTFWLDD